MKYTIEFCEREYNNRALIPEHPQIFARWAESGAVTRAPAAVPGRPALR